MCCVPQIKKDPYMQTPRSPNIAELGLALSSSCANINRLEIIDVTSRGNQFLLFGACRNDLSYTRYRDYRGYPHVYEDVASIYIGYQDEITDTRSVTSLVHDWFHMQDPLIDDKDDIEHVLMDNMRDVVQKMLRRLYSTGAYPPDHLQFLETRPSQVLEIRVWCKKTAEADCITPGWVEYLHGSIWFELGALERFQRNELGDYRGRITVVERVTDASDVVIQLVESEDGSISCLNLAREEVLSVPRNTDVQKLRHELAKIAGVSPHSLHLINERGELQTRTPEEVFIPPPSDDFHHICVPQNLVKRRHRLTHVSTPVAGHRGGHFPCTLTAARMVQMRYTAQQTAATLSLPWHIGAT